jgi:hypothetical protein
MGRRLGTPTGRAASGTVEEFEAAYQLWLQHRTPHLMFYFSAAPLLRPSLDDLPDIEAVLRFKKSLEKRGGFLAEFDSVGDLAHKVRHHLHLHLTEGEGPSEVSAPLAGGVFAVPSHPDAVRREEALAALAFACERSPLVALEGLSGSGKTFLMADYLRRAGLIGSTVWHDATTASSLDDLLSLLAPDVRFSSSSHVLKAKELMQHLAHRDRRLVIDGFHLSDRDSFRPLLEAASRIDSPGRLNVVSRARVNLRRPHRRVPASP